MKPKMQKVAVRKVCVWCGAVFADTWASAKVCGFDCADARDKEKCRVFQRKKQFPALFQQAIAQERAARELTWESIDALFGETFQDIERGES
jgi:hypothetical protein